MMLLKVMALSGIAVATVGFVFGREAVSYAWTGANSLRAAVKAEVPIEFEVERARQMVAQLVPEIRQCMHLIAEQQVDTDRVGEQVAQKLKVADAQKEAIFTLRKDLGTGAAKFTYAGRSFAAGEVERDLQVRFERFKTLEASLGADQKIHLARKQILLANQEKLATLMQSRQELEVKIEQLVARMETMRAAEAASSFVIDDSKLSQARQLLASLDRQLDVKERILDQAGQLTGSIPVEASAAPRTGTIASQIDAHFGINPAVNVVAASGADGESSPTH